MAGRRDREDEEDEEEEEEEEEGRLASRRSRRTSRRPVRPRATIKSFTDLERVAEQLFAENDRIFELLEEVLDALDNGYEPGGEEEDEDEEEEEGGIAKLWDWIPEAQQKAVADKLIWPMMNKVLEAMASPEGLQKLVDQAAASILAAFARNRPAE